MNPGTVYGVVAQHLRGTQARSTVLFHEKSAFLRFVPGVRIVPHRRAPSRLAATCPLHAWCGPDVDLCDGERGTLLGHKLSIHSIELVTASHKVITAAPNMSLCMCNCSGRCQRGLQRGASRPTTSHAPCLTSRTRLLLGNAHC